MAGSEVAQLRERIANEYMAAQWGLCGLAYSTAKHEFITARMERMAEHHQQLATIVGQQQATIMLAETLTTLPEQPQRAAVLEVIKQMRAETEQTAHLLDCIQEMWETIDVLVEEYGEEDARKIIYASATSTVKRAQGSLRRR